MAIDLFLFRENQTFTWTPLNLKGETEPDSVQKVLPSVLIKN